MTLKVDPAQVTAKAQQINQKAAQMESILNQMHQCMTALPQNAWEAVSGTNFAQAFENVRRDAQGAIERMRKNAVNLKEAAETYVRAETYAKQKVSNLNTGGIFN